MLANQILLQSTYRRLNVLMEEIPTLHIRNVLLAEDDDDDFNLLNAAILSINASIEILRTKNGVMFSSLLETSLKPDIIILDLNMPFKNGISCLEEIKSRKQYENTTVIIYSTSGTTKDIEASYQFGASFYLIKPTTYRGIIQQLKSLFFNDYFLKNIRPPREQFVLGNEDFSTFRYN